MKTIIALLAIIIMGAGAAAQETTVPDYTRIEKDIQDKVSPYYYPSLEARYNKADETLTTDQLRHLYYGSLFIARNVHTAAAAMALDGFNEILSKPNPTQDDYQHALEYSNILVQYKPFSILLKQYRTFCFKELGRYTDAAKERAQCEMIAEAILSSGTGADKAGSIHVIDTDNQQEVLGLLRFEASGESRPLTGNNEYVPVADNVYKTPGVYFYMHQPQREITGL